MFNLLLTIPNVFFFFYSRLLGCVTIIVWTYKLCLICTHTTFYPVQGMLRLNYYWFKFSKGSEINWYVHGTECWYHKINNHSSLNFQNKIRTPGGESIQPCITGVFVQMYGRHRSIQVSTVLRKWVRLFRMTWECRERDLRE